MLVECQKRGIVGKLTNMYDLYFADHKNDATVVPYMEGDYFPAEVENIIKDIEEGKGGKKSTTKGKSKDKKAKQKKKSGRGGTRSTGLDEEALKASGFIPPGMDSKSLEEGGRDYVMAKLGEIIHPMKESFIVAYLAWKEAKEENMVVPKEIQEYREQNGITWQLPDEPEPEKGEQEGPAEAKSSDPEEKLDDSSKQEPGTSETAKPDNAAESPDNNVTMKENDDDDPTDPSKPEETKSDEKGETAEPVKSSEDPNVDATDPPSAEEKSADDGASPMEGVTKEESPDKPPPSPVSDGVEKDAPGDDKTPDAAAVEGGETAENGQAAGNEEKKDSDASTEPKPVESKSDGPEKVTPNLAVREGKFAAMARKRELSGALKQESEAKKESEEKEKEEGEKKPENDIMVKDSKGRLVKVIDDDEEELDCEFLNNRQAFLNLCQGNHYQFDQLRRAKHTSMMVLWHLHNRDAPKFVQQCATCSREILQGYRFHCQICADFDQCQECISNPNVPRHPHQLRAVPVAGQQTELTPEQRRDRQRSIALHMTLLLHASTCTSAQCPSANCTKMKGLLKHGAQCTIKAGGGCNVCKRIWALLQIHARQCKNATCPVPHCLAIRERFRQLKQQQQAMDDRRRQEMNRAYRGKR
jgi:E1A/CREB-binding protein